MNRIVIIVMLASSVSMAAEIGPVKIQRRNDVEFVRGVRNDVGELTYSVGSDGRGTLTVGASEGDVVVSDPFAIRLAPQRILAADEWAATLDGAITLTADGVYKLFDAYKGVPAARTLTISAANPQVKLARVTYGSTSYMVDVTKTTTEQSCVIRGVSDYDSFWDPAGHGAHMHVSNIVVYAWTGYERTAQVDFTLADLTVTDSLGKYNMSALRTWITARYDHRTGDKWSQFPATHPVRLADRQIWFDPLGIVRMSSFQTDGTNAVAIMVNGSPVLEIVPGSAERTEQLKIVDYSAGATQAVFWVSAALGAPIVLQRTEVLEPANWGDVSTGISSTYPNTVQRTVGDTAYTTYRLTLAVDPEATSAFYRVKSTVGLIGATTVEIKNATLIYKGVPMGIVTQVVDGVSYETIGRVLP